MKAKSIIIALGIVLLVSVLGFEVFYLAQTTLNKSQQSKTPDSPIIDLSKGSSNTTSTTCATRTAVNYLVSNSVSAQLNTVFNGTVISVKNNGELNGAPYQTQFQVQVNPTSSLFFPLFKADLGKIKTVQLKQGQEEPIKIEDIKENDEVKIDATYNIKSNFPNEVVQMKITKL